MNWKTVAFSSRAAAEAARNSLITQGVKVGRPWLMIDGPWCLTVGEPA